ncbi:Uncharacterised protein [Escherichia coli]|nr:hypothetical protein [Escherichia coli]STK41513.1 Uncharacterised protein [Escherichia coli]
MEKIAKILDNYKPIDMVRASLWIFNDWDSDIEESIENAGGIFSSVEEMRSEKLREIYFTLGLSGVKDLFQQVNNVFIAARHISALSLDEEKLNDLFVMLINNKKILMKFVGC